MDRVAPSSRCKRARAATNLRRMDRLPMLFPKFAIFITTVGIALSISGCNSDSDSGSEENATNSQAQITPSVAKPQTQSVAPQTEVTQSPADAADKLPEKDATPDAVCKRFMELLRSGNRTTAENLLTRVALTTTSKAGLQLEPMGGPTATFEMGATKFATIKKEIAQVDCEIVESVEGDEIRTQLTWLMRKQKQGWRVAGLLIEVEPDKLKDLLSFENINDVERIKHMAAGDLADEIDDLESRQADATAGDSLLK